MSKLQNEDFKSEAQITGAGGTASQLLNDTKIYVTADGINKTLDDAIADGDIGGGGSSVLTTYIKDLKSAGTAGGGFTSGSWQTRDLNTQTADTSFATLSSNQIVLIAGTYDITATAPGFRVNRHQAKLRNVTDSTDAIIGSSGGADDGANNMDLSVIIGRVTIASTKTFEIQHQCGTTRATDGFGQAANLGVSEVYTQIRIDKL